MQQNDLLRIFTPNEIKDLSHETLVKYRKQKLLMFQMTEKYTIELNGHEVDKNTVISIFETLELSLDSLLVQHKIPGLQSFLSCPDMSKFHLILNVDFNELSYNDKTSVLARISDKINRQLGLDIKKGKIVPSQIKWITDFYNRHLSHDFDGTYSNVYTILNEYIYDISEEYDQPFANEYGTKLKPQIIDLINSTLYDSLSALPESFESLKISYSRWCHSNVLYEAFNRTNEFNRYDRTTLLTLQQAMFIAANYFQPKHHQDNAKLVSSYLSQNRNYSRNSGSDDSGCGGVGIVIGIFIFLIKFSILFRNCGDSSPSYNRNSYGYSQSQDELNDFEAHKIIMEKMSEQERMQYVREGLAAERVSYNSESSSVDNQASSIEDEAKPNETLIYPAGGSSVKTIKVLKDYAGTNKLALNTEVNQIIYNDDLVEIHFSCDALPMYHENYSRLVPKSVIRKLKGNVIDAVFIFKPRGLKETSTHVSLKIDLKSKAKYPATSFGFVNKSNEQEKKLHLRKIKTKDFKFDGYIQNYKIGAVKEKRRLKFNIKFDKTQKEYSFSESGGRYQSLGRDIRNDVEDEKLAKYKSLVNNIKIVQDKYLRQASIYTIENSTYCINVSDINKMIFDPGILKMYITSIGDGNTYAELKMDKSLVNYIIDEEGFIKTVQQITYDRDRKIVERILMTRS